MHGPCMLQQRASVFFGSVYSLSLASLSSSLSSSSSSSPSLSSSSSTSTSSDSPISPSPSASDPLSAPSSMSSMLPASLPSSSSTSIASASSCSLSPSTYRRGSREGATPAGALSFSPPCDNGTGAAEARKLTCCNTISSLPDSERTDSRNERRVVSVACNPASLATRSDICPVVTAAIAFGRKQSTLTIQTRKSAGTHCHEMSAVDDKYCSY